MMNFRPSLIAAAVCAASMALSGPALAQTAPAQPEPTFEPSEGQAGKDVIWLPTSQVLVDRMLAMARLTPKDHLIDLGSGDGRLVITAAKRGATAHGIEYNPDFVAFSQRAAQAEGVSQRATFEKADIFESDFSKATVITLFLLPDLNMRLRPTLLDMKPGTRVVSNSFNMGDWTPDQTAEVTEGCQSYCQAFQWTVPAKVAGTWRLGDGRELVLKQSFQMLEGSLRQGGQARPISEARMDGPRISFVAGGQRYAGEVNGQRMQGTVAGGTQWRATQATPRR
ncbi:cyclopropane-fatty-acyl-phospholipid synthase family protein [Hydrogenophaga sp.]|uniref:SAM-dependent methyltransferase n=1 Tax=Hydrogenophaga sp. TaxID=1904254 RepID=UPI002721CAA3|nr:class I SAM-dependent methyltransferase [Hydrogenophaga sp.]MDO9134568.1 class I SAM-dependent methyltransferase [Hydrogenophaga sp.]